MDKYSWVVYALIGVSTSLCIVGVVGFVWFAKVLRVQREENCLLQEENISASNSSASVRPRSGSVMPQGKLEQVYLPASPPHLPCISPCIQIQCGWCR